MGAVAAVAGVMGGLSLVEGFFGASQAEEQEKSRVAALKERMRQQKDAAQFQSIQRDKRINATLGSQAALQAFQGGGTAGLVSSNMISLNDMNAFASDENAARLSEIFQEKGISSSIDAAVRQGEAAQEQALIGGVTGAVSHFSDAYILSQGTSPSSISPYNTGVSLPPPQFTNTGGNI